MNAFAPAQAGDERALCALTREHMPLVWMLAGRCAAYARREEAFQQGCIGLVRAIRLYDPSRDTAFSTYAAPFILGEIRRALSASERGLGWRARRKLREAERAREALAEKSGREPGVNEIAAACGLSPEEYCLLLEGARTPDAFDERESALPDPGAAGWMERFLLRDIVSRLTEDEQRLIGLRYALNRPQKEVARLLRVSQSRVSRREKAACLHIRDSWLEEN